MPGAHEPKTVRPKVTRISLCIKTVIRLSPTVYRYFIKSSPLPTYFSVPDRSVFIIPKCLPGGGRNYSYATCASASDSFSGYLALYKLVCMHVCMYVCMYVSERLNAAKYRIKPLTLRDATKNKIWIFAVCILSREKKTKIGELYGQPTSTESNPSKLS